MNLTIDEILRVYKNQKKHYDENGIKSMQLLMAEDLLKLYEKLEEARNERGNSSSN